MAQHDYVIDNSTGANVRADINSVLQAISSNNSGSSAPSTTYALQSFANTTDSMLQLRNAANNAFVNLRKFDGTLPLPDGTASSPSIFFDDDTNTGLFSSAADTLNFSTGGVERMELGTATVFNEDGADVDFRIEGDTEANLFYVDAGNNRIGIGTSSPNTKLDISAPSVNSSTLSTTNCKQLGQWIRTVSANNTTGDIQNGIAFGEGFSGLYSIDAGSSAAQHLAFFTGTNSAVAERMRIDSSGNLLLGATTIESGFGGIVFRPNNSNGAATQVFDRTDTTATSFALSFENNNSGVGFISYTNSAVQFNTGSDYRLKENQVPISDGITRLKTLKPYRFNFKVDPTKTVDGFFAHEVTAVPEAVTGTKDEVDADNKPVYQGIDQSKLVPLLTAALQEAIGKIEILETKVAALEAI